MQLSRDPLVHLRDALTRPLSFQDSVFHILSQRELQDSLCGIMGINTQALHPDSALKIELELEGVEFNKTEVQTFWDALPDVLSKFGKVLSVLHDGTVRYEHPLSCWLAKHALDGYCIHEFEMKIRASLDLPLSERALAVTKGLAYGRDRGIIKNIVMPQQLIADLGLVGGRYACKYEVQIRNENEFGVGKRIIGPAGQHMKEIISRATESQEADSRQDLKVLLRGLGSNFNCCPQGPGKPALVPESEEPLHITISSKYLEVYTRACQLVESLLIRIYEDLKRFDASGPSLKPKLLASRSN